MIDACAFAAFLRELVYGSWCSHEGRYDQNAIDTESHRRLIQDTAYKI